MGTMIDADRVAERYGVVPDIVALSKATGGGTPIGAVPGTDEIMPGADEQWALSTAHDDRDLHHYVGVFEEFALNVTNAAV